MSTFMNANTLRSNIKFAEQNLSKKDYVNLIRSLQSKSGINAVLSVDLSGLQSLTADKLSLLVNCKKYADEKGVKLVLKSVSPSLEAFFELTRMKNFFQSSSSLIA
jgi:anti-anti-sigma regulatory factor